MAETVQGRSLERNPLGYAGVERVLVQEMLTPATGSAQTNTKDSLVPSISEETLNQLTHGAGLALSIAGAVRLLTNTGIGVLTKKTAVISYNKTSSQPEQVAQINRNLVTV